MSHILMPCEVRAEVEEIVVIMAYIHNIVAQIKDLAPVIEIDITFAPRIKQTNKRKPCFSS